MMQGQMKSGCTRVLDGSDPNVELGFAYTEPYADGSGQLERWLLYRDPNNLFSVTLADKPTAIDLPSWQALVRSKWKSGCFYVWAYADVYMYGGTYDGVKWTKIPWPLAPRKTAFTTTKGQACWTGTKWWIKQGEQTDPGHCGVKQSFDTSKLEGWIYTEGGLLAATSTEYWALPPSFVGAGTPGVSTKIEAIQPPRTATRWMSAALERLAQQGKAGTDTEKVMRAIRIDRRAAWTALAGRDAPTELQTYVDGINAFYWTPGSAFVITTCFNYQGSAPPTSP